MTCLLIFVHGLWEKIDQWKSLQAYSGPMTLVKRRIAWSPAQNSLPVLYTGLEISTKLSVRHEHKNTSCSDVT